MSDSPVEETFIDGSEVCRLLGVKPATLYAYVSRGILKSYKQGIKRQRLYKKDEVLKLLAVRPSDEVPAGQMRERARQVQQSGLAEAFVAAADVPFEQAVGQ